MPKSDFRALLQSKQREYLLSAFYIFCRDTRIVPDYCDMPHREMCDELEACIPEFGQRRQKKKIYLAPRHSYKTSIIKAFMIFLYLKFPNIRIVYGRATHEDAKGVLLAVKEILTRNVVLIELWGDLSKTAVIWAEERIVLSRPDSTLADATIDTTGLGGSLTGKHPDIIIFDDLVTDYNYRSDATTERSRNILWSAYPVLPPHGSIVVAGTRWAANDIYGWLMAEDDRLEEEHKPREWGQYIRSAYLPDGSLFFPTVISEEFLEQQRRSLRTNMMLFSSWYYNQPYEIGTKLFPRHYITYFEADYRRSPSTHLEFPDGRIVPLYVVCTIDPAPTVGPRSDFTGVVVNGYDYQGKWYVLWAEAIKKVPSERARHVMAILRTFYPPDIVIETGQADPEFVALLQSALKLEGMNSRIISYSALQDEARGERGKGQRIEALEPIFRENVISFRRGSPMRDLMAQLDGYPSIDHDDVLDALAMQRKFARACREKTYQDMQTVEEDQEELDSWGPEGRPAKTVKAIKGGWVGRGSQVYRF
jgi:predicted phage terminase large subunit-like protein